MIPQQDIDRILSLDTVEVIGSFIDLKKKGTNYVGNCPFHNEKTGSFTVSAEKKMYKCFGCGKSGNLINFVMEYEHLEYVEAIKHIAGRFHVMIDDKYQPKKTGPVIEKHSAGIDAVEFKTKNFTKYELSLLGKDITADICEKHFSLFSLEYYITKKNDKGESWKISSTDDFPIMVYDYNTWGKIYQPLSPDFRFTYWGDKPDTWIFGDTKTAKYIEKARRGELPSRGEEEIETENGDIKMSEDQRINDLVLCSGGSDAMNVFAQGYNVCWLNSETADLEDYEYRKLLQPICKNMYILYDLDETGTRQAFKIALKYLDIAMVWLPEDLRRFKDRKGKPCKDVKDFFMYYRSSRHRNVHYYFKLLMNTALSLMFWMKKYDNRNNFTGYDINNEQLYGFLSAMGLYALPSKQEKKGFSYVHINDNIVSEIPEEQIQSFVNHLLVKYIKENIEYYNIGLINAIHRSNQVKISSLEKIRKIELNFRSYGIDYDYFFFRNCALKITNKGIEQIKMEDIGVNTWDFKIIDHNFSQQKAPFSINYTDEYSQLLNVYKSTDHKSENYKEIKKKVDTYSDMDKYELELDDSFSFIKYVYNTGRVHWEKRSKGIPLSERERKEEDLHFINKVAAIGYMLYRYKDPSRAYMVYAMETEQSQIGKHLGGTGKSLFFSAIEKVRRMAFIDGQRRNIADNDTLFSEVKENVTEFVYFDDLNKNVDLHLFMPMVTGKMEVRALYCNKIILDFADSPKFGISSNHAVSNFDSSLRRRSWFTAFSNYYHSENKARGTEERSPRTEFGKNLLLDYDESEMNQFYNFMAYCLHTYLKFRHRINPPMESIEKRNLQRILGDEFIYWAEDYLTDDRLNVNIEKNELLDAYKKTMPGKFADMIKMRTFKEKLQTYCEYKGYIFNPSDLLNTETESERNEIREAREGQDLYFYHIRTAPPCPQNNDRDGIKIDDSKPF